MPVREVAYDTLLQKQRRDFHARVARAIELLYPERIEEFVELIAFHYQRGEVPERAAAYL